MKPLQALLDRLRSLDVRRVRALQQAQAGPLHDYLSQPFVPARQALAQTPIVALDFETTGLDPRQHEIVSIGLVEFSGGCIDLASSWHALVKVAGPMSNESVVIHQITHDQMKQGRTLEELLPELLRRLRGKVLLAHYRKVEMQFLSVACEKLYGAPFLIPVIDTLELGQRRMQLRNHTIQANDLRLFNLRQNFQLPRYQAHNALLDALATAELFLAMSADMAPAGKAKLNDFLSHS